MIAQFDSIPGELICAKDNCDIEVGQFQLNDDCCINKANYKCEGADDCCSDKEAKVGVKVSQ